jgi:CIC family chloride channel protein
MPKKYKLSYRTERFIGCGVAAELPQPLTPYCRGFICYRSIACRCEYCSLYSYYDCCCNWALVSVIALDEEILLSFKQQQSFDYHNIFSISY